ncbi:hypothetical protein CBR_g38200 [Chara braunii]|uniref:Uncharacterized protein n=1 Tax=Chara braunii TaxID=69332 RepID=A0A388LPP3_CHABU|nr:hypothetical protein CBR_g38200 [Chara braunii]|eukprot:GBG84229.1 hypothetical protein CBR_g38200 [Chara braunii]
MLDPSFNMYLEGIFYSVRSSPEREDGHKEMRPRDREVDNERFYKEVYASAWQIGVADGGFVAVGRAGCGQSSGHTQGGPKRWTRVEVEQRVDVRVGMRVEYTVDQRRADIMCERVDERMEESVVHNQAGAMLEERMDKGGRDR